MSDEVIFEEDTLTAVRPGTIKAARKQSLFLRLAYKSGLATNEKEAQMLMLSVVGVCIVLIVIFLFVGKVI